MNWCKIGIHNYGKWEITRKGRILDRIFRDKCVGYYIEQQKVCRDCRKIKLRTEETEN